jgi:small GTP-binding protein
MDERLLGIVDEYGCSVDQCVDEGRRKLLAELTKRYALSYMWMLDWSRVRYLNIVGAVDWLGYWEHELERGCYVDSSGKFVLLVGLKTHEVQKCVDRCTGNLIQLVIACTEIKQLRIPTQKLKILRLIAEEQLTHIVGLDQLTKLQNLAFCFSKCDVELDLTPYPDLRELVLTDSEVRSIRSERILEKLDVCWLQFSQIENVDFLAHCPNVNVLNLDRTGIRRLPEEILQMSKLRLLFAGELKLEELPDWLPELGLTMGRMCGYDIQLDGTTVEGVDMSIFDQSQDMIRAWFAARKKAKCSTVSETDNVGGPLRQIKVVFLGDGSTGKSLTVARLLNGGEKPADFDGEATPGIAIADKDYILPDGRDVQVHFWDFGGQEILHSMHRIFLTDRTMYVVMINARNNTQDAQARYWLHNVQSFAPNCPVLLVLNQIDQNPNASVNKRSLKKNYPNLKEIIRLSAFTFNQDKFNREFTHKMLAQIAEFKSLDAFFPAEWTKTMERVRQMKGNYIKGSEFKQICHECGVEGDRLRLDLLKWFHDIGVSFCCGKTRRLLDYVVLNPEWITNGIYTIIWNKHDKAANGMVDREEIYRLLNPGEGDDIQQVRSDMTYELSDVDFVLDVSRKFRLSFRMDDEKEFIPMLCDANALPEADTFPEEPGVLEFRMEYDYLPLNVVHRLMVDMRRDLQKDKVWLTGALLRQQYNGVQALVKTEGDVLSIYIKAADRAHKAHTYLNTIRGALDAIHRDMGLKEPATMVAYNEDGEKDYFPYETLEGARRYGQLTQYSNKFRRLIPIEDILNGTDSQVEEKKLALLRDIAKACMQLQSNRNLVCVQKSDGKLSAVAEDDRNDVLRDALRNMGYHVADQTHLGTGSTGIRAGSLDMQLLHEDNLPWTAIEALNITGASESHMKYWDNHLEKLMNNYDPTGLPTLFLLTYVNCKADRYHGMFSAYTERMRQVFPSNCELRHGTLTDVLPLGQQHGSLRVTRCTYDRCGTPVTVYHYFVGFIRDKEMR